MRVAVPERNSIKTRAHRFRRLRSESLENRIVMAAAVDLTPEGLLSISGDAEDNRITVVTSRSGERLRVSVDGRSQDFDANLIQRIAIAAGDGNDGVRISSNTTASVRINGGDGNDRIRAGGGQAFIQGGEGRDRIRGSRLDDIIFGGAGLDQISAGPGDDIVVGGDGRDRISGGAGDDIIFGDAVNGLPPQGPDVELLAFLRANANELEGNDVISGGLGDDSVYAGNGNDRVRGGAGNDLLLGGAGRDSLSGQRGDDELVGGPGRDLLRGGAGADTIRAVDQTVDLIIADVEDELFTDDVDIIRGLPSTIES